MPFSWGVFSNRAPTLTQTPRAMDSTSGMKEETIRNPFSRVVSWGSVMRFSPEVYVLFIVSKLLGRDNLHDVIEDGLGIILEGREGLGEVGE